MIAETIGYFIIGLCIGYWVYEKLIDKIISTVAFLLVGYSLIENPEMFLAGITTWSWVLCLIFFVIGYLFGKYYLHNVAESHK